MRISVKVWGGAVIALASLMVLAGAVGDETLAINSLAPPSVLSAVTVSPQVPKVTAGSLPEFPDNLTHFVWIVRENHVFDDYLGDCSIDINDTCNGGKSYNTTTTATKTETAASGDQLLTPYLHDFAREYSVFDNMYTTLDPYSAQAHAFIFTANAWGSSDSCVTGGAQGVGAGSAWAIYNSSSVKAGSCAYSADSGSQSYNITGGSVFDRFLGPNVPQSKTTIPFLLDGDAIWELSSPGCSVASSKAIPGDNEKSLEITTGCTNGWWYNSTSSSPDMPPTVNEATGIPQMLWECEYYCTGVAPSTFLDSYASDSYVDYLNDYGLPTYSFIELFDDHPGNNCGLGQATCIKDNDAAMGQIVDAIENNSAWANSTGIVVTEDETQNGQNDLDHENSGRRVPFVFIAPHSVMKSGGAPSTCGISTSYASCGFVVHQTFNYSNVEAVMERVEMNVNPNTFYVGGISPNSTKFPMVENDYLAEGNPLEPLWKCGEPGVPCNTGVTTGTGPTITAFTASPATIAYGGTDYLNATVTGGVGALSYAYTGLPSPCASSNASKITCAPTAAGTYSIKLTVTDTAKNTATATASFTMLPKGGGVAISSFTAGPPTLYLAGTTDLNVSAVGGTGPLTYTYSSLPAGCLNANVSSLPCTPTAPGTYTVDVNVTDSVHPTPHYATSSVSFTVNPMTITSFIATPGTIAPGGTTSLSAKVAGGFPSLTYSYTGLPASCPSSSVDPLSCTTSTVGNYTVTLTVKDAKGNTANATATFSVSKAPSVITSVTITPSAGYASVNGSATFTAQAYDQYSNPLNSGITYDWTLSGSPSPGTLVTSTNTATFKAGPTAGLTGKINVSATQSGSPNLVTQSSTISVFGVTGTVSTTSGKAPLTVTFDGSASGGTGSYTYYWSFGNGIHSSDQDPSYTYTKAGSFTPTLVANDTVSVETSTWTLPTITVSQATSTPPSAPTVSVAASPTSGTSPLAVTFTAQASGGSGTYSSYSWNFGDNSPAGSGASVSHTYTGTGTYPVEVNVTDSNGRSGYGFTNITVTSSSPNKGNQNQSSSSIPLWEWVAIGVIALLVLALVAVIATRPRKQAPSGVPPWQGGQAPPGYGPQGWQPPPGYGDQGPAPGGYGPGPRP